VSCFTVDVSDYSKLSYRRHTLRSCSASAHTFGMTSRSGDDFPFPYASTADCYAIGIALPAVALVVTGLRLYTRRIQHASLGLDDWLIVAGLVGLAGLHLQQSLIVSGRYP
jgi:hypothetical protein